MRLITDSLITACLGIPTPRALTIGSSELSFQPEYLIRVSARRRQHSKSSEIGRGRTVTTEMSTIESPGSATDGPELARVGIHRQRKVIAALGAAGMLATFLPWITAPIVGAVYGTAGDGWISFALFALATGIAFVGDRSRPLTAALLWPAVVAPAIAASALGVFKFFHIQDMKESLSSDQFGSVIAPAIQIGPGLYLLVAAGVALTVWASLTGLTRKRVTASA